MKTFKYNGIDCFRLIAAFLIIAIHIGPLSSINNTLDFGFTYVLCRIGVPFFLMTTGYFILYPVAVEGNDNSRFVTFLKDTLILYVVSVILYLPVNIYSGAFNKSFSIWGIIKSFFFDGTFYHLWYLPAVLIGCIFVYLLCKKVNIKNVFIISLFLYLIGLFGDSYYGFIENIHFINSFYDIVFKVTSFTRNGIFYAPVFLVLGMVLRKVKCNMQFKSKVIFFVISMSLMLMEGLLLHYFDIQRHTSMYIFLLPSMFFFFQILLDIKGNRYKDLRNISMYIYIIHPAFIIAVRMFAKVFGSMSVLIDNSMLNYLIVSILSFLFAVIFNILFTKYKEKKNV